MFILIVVGNLFVLELYTIVAHDNLEGVLNIITQEEIHINIPSFIFHPSVVGLLCYLFALETKKLLH